MICYVVMIQNDEYKTPSICMDFNSENAAEYSTKEKAEEFISWMVEEGYPREDYFVAQVVRLEE